MKRRTLWFLLALALATAPAFAQGGAQDTGNEEPLARFPVAHQHMNGSWCIGYLSVFPDKIRYVVFQGNRGHSFLAGRTEIEFVRPWINAGTRLNAAELKLADVDRALDMPRKMRWYHFFLLDDAAVRLGRAYQWNPPDAGAADLLINAIRDPATAAQAAATLRQTQHHKQDGAKVAAPQ